MVYKAETFRAAAEAKRGRLELPPPLLPFVDRVVVRFGIRPLWVATDHVSGPGRSAAGRRVDLVFERTAERAEFLTDSGAFSPAHQDTIAHDFQATVSATEQARLFGAASEQGFDATPFVCFSDFERAARERVHTTVPMTAIDRMAAAAGFGKAYWRADRLWGAPTIFLHTDQQVADFSSDKFRARLDDAYFKLALPYDEFGVLERRDTRVALDSLQNFDSNYQSNWYYYWK